MRSFGSQILVLTLLATSISPTTTKFSSEVLIGIVGRDFVLLGADTAPPLDSLSHVQVKKIHPISSRATVATAGSPADTDRMVGYIKSQNLQNTDSLTVQGIAFLSRNYISKRLRTAHPCSASMLVAGTILQERLSYESMSDTPGAIIRRQVEASLSRRQAGFDAGESPAHSTSEATTESPLNDFHQQPSLYWIDAYGTMLSNVPYAVVTSGSNQASAVTNSHRILSFLDRHYQPNMSHRQASVLLRECMCMLGGDDKDWTMRCIDTSGCHVVNGQELQREYVK